jgi:transposase InsO family protein
MARSVTESATERANPRAHPSRWRARSRKARPNAPTRQILGRYASPNPAAFINGRARDELLNLEDFASLLEAQVVAEAWRIEYNTYRPHGALGGLTPAEVRAAWTTEHQRALS